MLQLYQRDLECTNSNLLELSLHGALNSTSARFGMPSTPVS